MTSRQQSPGNPFQTIFLLLTLCAVGALLYGSLDFYPLLSQGDHGRDLYAFAQTLQGHMPYRDYWWAYGPLMPCYYSVFLSLGGINILSVLLGKAVLTLASTALFYLILARMISPAFSFLGALWFFHFNLDFFYTFNHAGGIVFLMAMTCALVGYIQQPSRKYWAWGLFSIFGLAMVKINIALASLGGFLVSVFLADFLRKKDAGIPRRSLFFHPLALLAAIIGVYALLTRDLPIDYIRQCFPYLKGDEPYHSGPFWITLQTVLQSLCSMSAYNISAGWGNFFFSLIILLSLGHTLYLIGNKNSDVKHRTQLGLVLLSLSLLYALNLHEYLVSGVLYRTFWAKPFSILLMFFLIGTAVRGIPWAARLGLAAAMLLTLTIQTTEKFRVIHLIRAPSQYLSMERGKVFLGNHPAWMQTVYQTYYFLKTHVPADETFFALPYDPLYYYLCDKTSPTRQLIFFEHIKITSEQERMILQELENRRIRWVVLSSRAASGERGLGILGETYCPLIGDYLKKKFKVEAEFGDWGSPPGWAWNHGVRILKRVE